jgi:hypothetical protein
MMNIRYILRGIRIFEGCKIKRRTKEDDTGCLLKYLGNMREWVVSCYL